MLPFMALTQRPTVAECDRLTLPTCWYWFAAGKTIIPHNIPENRLPKSTGRAEVTVLPCGFRPCDLASAFSTAAWRNRENGSRAAALHKCRRKNFLKCERIRAA
jgi:hypothetical protein